MDRHDGVCRDRFRAPTRAGLADAKEVSQCKISARLAGLVVEAGLEGRQQRSSAHDVLLQRAALGVAEQRHIGQDEGCISGEPRLGKILFMHEIERNSGLGEHRIHPLDRICLIFRGGRVVERDRSRCGDNGDSSE